MLIDDNPISNLAHEAVIRQTANVKELVVAHGPSEALGLLELRKKSGNPAPDLIFLDVVMPECTGWEFLRRLKRTFGEIDKGSVVILTADADVRDVFQCALHPEVRDYLTKPLSDVETQRIFDEYTWQAQLRFN